MVWALSTSLFQPMPPEWVGMGVPASCLVPLTRSWVPRHPHLCSSSPCREAGGHQGSALIKDPFPHCCCGFVLLQGRKIGPGKDLRAGGLGKGGAILPFLLFPCSSGSSASTLQARLGYKDPRAKSLIGEKKTRKSCSLL